RLRPVSVRLSLLGLGCRECRFRFVELGAGGAVISFLRFWRSSFRDRRVRRRFRVGEQGAEPAWLELALKPPLEQFACSLFVDGGGQECLANRSTAGPDQPLQRCTFTLGRRCEIPLPADLSVAQCSRRPQDLLNLAAMLPPEP